MPTAIPNPIEIRIEEISQLFDMLDPFPFRERDLDKDAEEFIVGWARELPAHLPIRILIHLPKAEAETAHARDLDKAINRYFGYRADMVGRDIRELFRVGWRSLLIGLVVLALCIVGSRLAARALGPVGPFLEEGLIILGWVANWRPLEIFLYDWWPLLRRRDLYRRLGEADIELVPK
jgi:hypothetical protein